MTSILVISHNFQNTKIYCVFLWNFPLEKQKFDVFLKYTKLIRIPMGNIILIAWTFRH